jgi:hypothetical protein
MAQVPPKKRNKRRIQLREAQRRRRARLKEESKTFLQIILAHDMLMALRRYSSLVGKPLHACAAELIERGLHQVHELEIGQRAEKREEPPAKQFVPAANGDHPGNTQPEATAEKSASEHGRPEGQMELFAGFPSSSNFQPTI